MASFQLKNFVSIAASMINRMKATQTQLTDFNVGALGRTLVEAPAAEIDELYQQAFNLVNAAIPVSVYTSFSFPALTALAATGLVRVVITAQTGPSLVSGGTQFTATTTSVAYASSSDVIIPAGSTYADVPVAATTTGAATNLPANTQFSMTPSPDGFISATNLSAFDNGINAETDPEQQIRFNNFISTLPRGTVAALKYGLSLTTVTDALGNVTERVVFSSIVEPYLNDDTQPFAYVQCFIHNGVGSTSSALVAQANQIIYGYYLPDGTPVPGWKAAGVKVDISAATEMPLAVTGTLEALAGYDQPTLCTLAQSAIFTYLQSLPIGTSALFSEMIALVMGITGVANFTLTAPVADTSSTPSTKIMPGTIAIT
ncbi:baseplate J/gp47 family protein [Paraburkholderia sp. MM6662-R1]|uniref:baseplate J/gp47 family protein n=1 Tax=Paraburkholderia sp. MM6662-R1 TaxID=2991066 RepID=UPI003D22D182